MSQNSLSFVISSGAGLQDDPPVRRLIRPGSATITTTNPIEVMDSSFSHRTSSEESHEEDLSLQPGCWLATYTRMRSNGTQSNHARRTTSTRDTTQSPVCLHPEFDFHSTAYEGACSRFQVDLTDLTMLTNFNIGRGTIAALAADPSRLLSLIGGTGW
ncbi:hypothetical protein N7478_010472 [Penicillium angulare]|uniref:uncharacterized protein n=1 Tax=Penicillium angulare TaxID=116970 RepID=UPI0025418FB6|nr:uncharacterized protein N7478_010472 [Penicillium angulare]KAJ5267664.1 hypothetical protein N7478_010472 [Penicillium angulare]